MEEDIKCWPGYMTWLGLPVTVGPNTGNDTVTFTIAGHEYTMRASDAAEFARRLLGAAGRKSGAW